MPLRGALPAAKVSFGEGFSDAGSERGADDYDNYDSRHPKPFTYLAACGVRVIPEAEVHRGCSPATWRLQR
jgi:hypothetical protein